MVPGSYSPRKLTLLPKQTTTPRFYRVPARGGCAGPGSALSCGFGVWDFILRGPPWKLEVAESLQALGKGGGVSWPAALAGERSACRKDCDPRHVWKVVTEGGGLFDPWETYRKTVKWQGHACQSRHSALSCQLLCQLPCQLPFLRPNPTHCVRFLRRYIGSIWPRAWNVLET